MGDTGEIHRNGGGAINRAIVAILTTLTIGAIAGGVSAWSDGRITAAELATHKLVEERRLDELARAVSEMRSEMKSELRDLRGAVERRR